MKPKLESLDAVRAIACLFVVSFHAYLTLFGYSGLSMFSCCRAFCRRTTMPIETA